jgi:hypothetical protein
MLRNRVYYPKNDRIILLNVMYLRSGKPSSWLPRKLKFVMHDVLKKSFRFPRVTLHNNTILQIYLCPFPNSVFLIASVHELLLESKASVKYYHALSLRGPSSASIQIKCNCKYY